MNANPTTITENKLSSNQARVVATGFFSLFSVVGIIFYGLPFFFDLWVQDFGWSRATVTSGNLIGKIIIGPLFGFVTGWIIDRFGPKRVMIAGIVFCAAGIIGLSTMNSLSDFYTFYLLLALGYMCGGPLPNQVLTSRWFSKSRGKAMGIAYLGIGFGGMLVPQLAKMLNIEFGWRGSLLVLAGLIILIGLPMIFIVKENSDSASPVEDVPLVPLKTVVRSKAFFFLAIGSMCSIGAVAGISQNLKLFVSMDLKYSQEAAANLISMALGASIVGRLLMGWLADRYSKKYIMVLIYSLITLSIVLLNFANSTQVIMICAVLFGIGLGGDYMIIPLMAADLFGVKIMGRVMGLILTLDGFAEALGPILAGRLRDHFGDYSTAFIALAILSVIGTISVMLLPRNSAQR